MPTVLLLNGIRYFFCSRENNEPPHVHVTKASAEGKIWLSPDIEAVYLFGFTNSERHQIMETVTMNAEDFKKRWNEYFNQ